MPKRNKKNGKLGNLVFCHLRCFGSVQWLELSKQRLLPVFVFGVFGSVQRHEQTKQPFTWPVCFSVSELRLSFLKKNNSFFFEPNKLGLFTSV